MIKQIDENSVSLPRPKFGTKVANMLRMYRHAKNVLSNILSDIPSYTKCVAKRQVRRKLEKISDIVNSREYVEKQKNRNYEYNTVFHFIDWKNNDKNLAHKSC